MVRCASACPSGLLLDCCYFFAAHAPFCPPILRNVGGQNVGGQNVGGHPNPPSETEDSGLGLVRGLMARLQKAPMPATAVGALFMTLPDRNNHVSAPLPEALRRKLWTLRCVCQNMLRVHRDAVSQLVCEKCTAQSQPGLGAWLLASLSVAQQTVAAARSDFVR